MKAVAMQRELVQRTIGQMHDHNVEEINGFYTRPALDMYIVNRYWKYLTKGMSEAEIEDFKQVKAQLDHYGKIYDFMEYGATLGQTMTALEQRISSNNPSIPLTIYRKSRRNSVENIAAEIDQILTAYYSLIDDCAEHPVWQRKIEEELGMQI